MCRDAQVSRFQDERSDKSHQNHFAPRLTCRDVLMPRADGSARAAFAPPLNLGRGTSDFTCLSGSADGTSDLHGWRKCKRLSGTILALCRRTDAGLQRSAFPALACKSRADHPWRARSAGQRSTGPLSLSASPRPAPLRGSAMYRDVQVPRVQDACERPSAALIRCTGSTSAAGARKRRSGLGSTVGTKQQRQFTAYD